MAGGGGIERGVGCVEDGAAAERGVLDASESSTFFSCARQSQASVNSAVCEKESV